MEKRDKIALRFMAAFSLLSLTHHAFVFETCAAGKVLLFSLALTTPASLALSSVIGGSIWKQALSALLLFFATLVFFKTGESYVSFIYLSALTQGVSLGIFASLAISLSLIGVSKILKEKHVTA